MAEYEEFKICRLTELNENTELTEFPKFTELTEVTELTGLKELFEPAEISQLAAPVLVARKRSGLSAVTLVKWAAFWITSLGFLLKADDSKIQALLKDIKQITFQGRNSQSSLSTNFEAVVFVSEKRHAHFHQEIYRVDLITKKERRITFQTGTLAEPQILLGDQIAYLSTTDEDKELSDTVVPAAGLPRTEIYLSDDRGREIERLTENAGFDGAYDPGKNAFQLRFAIRWHEGQSQIVSFVNDGKNINTPKVVLSSTKARYVALDSIGEFLYWIEETGDLKEQSLYRMKLEKTGPITKVKRKLIDFAGKVERMSLVNEGKNIIFGFKAQDPDQSLIVSANLENKCAVSLLSLIDQVQFGSAVSKDSQVMLTYERKVRDETQVFLATVSADLATCQETAVKGVNFK